MTLFGYHYTTPGAHAFMMRDWIPENKRGLIPQSQFISEARFNEDKMAGRETIDALLEPKPSNWAQNPLFPHLFDELMHHLYYGHINISDNKMDNVISLIRFPILETNEAYIVERAHMENFFYGFTTDENKANREYLASRIPALEYAGGFILPQFKIHSRLEPERLELLWEMPMHDFWDSTPIARTDPLFKRTPHMILYDYFDMPKIEGKRWYDLVPRK